MVQIRLWEDCYNNCTFCSLENKKSTSLEVKKIRLNKLLSLPIEHRYGIIGGEFFEGQLYGCEDEWFKFIKNLKCNELFITANLINNQYLLKETLNVRPDILICTSYDTVGRFKSEEQKLQWFERVKWVKETTNKISCTMILTQDLLNDNFVSKLPKYCNLNLSEPFVSTKWYYYVNKNNYHQCFLNENKKFNLPKRKDFLKWISNPIYKDIIYNMQHYKNNHFGIMLEFDKNNNIAYYDRFNDQNFLAKCGHPYLSRCYADSDHCVACDLEEL